MRYGVEMQTFSSECPLLSMARQVMISAQLADADAVMAMRVEECLQRWYQQDELLPMFVSKTC